MYLPGTSRTVHFALITIGAIVISSVMLFGQTTTADQAATNAYGGCSAPAKAGVHVCFPFNLSNGGAGVASPFQVIAAGTGAGGPVKLMEVWADGKKIAQTSGNLFDAPVTLPIESSLQRSGGRLDRGGDPRNTVQCIGGEYDGT
jgi:hypothetical protein